jgi:hypothetical protein
MPGGRTHLHCEVVDLRHVRHELGVVQVGDLVQALECGDANALLLRLCGLAHHLPRGRCGAERGAVWRGIGGAGQGCATLLGTAQEPTSVVHDMAAAVLRHAIL